MRWFCLLNFDLTLKTIYINGKFFSQRITGTQRYARELLNQFDRLLSSGQYPSLAFEILVPKNVGSIPRYASLPVRTVGRGQGTLWEQMELPRYCAGHILFTLSGGAPILHSENVVTLHDAAVAAAPSGYSRTYRVWHRTVCRRTAKTAQHLFTDSNFSKSEIVKWYGADPNKISVSYLGSDHFSNLEADPLALQRFGISGKYVLAVSSHNPNKNFLRVAQAMDHLPDTQLVIAGGQDSRIYRGTGSLPHGVQAVGYVTDRELKALYQNAACFVFASLYEGFGLPPLEAISTGCTVVLSRAASLPEIFEGAAHFCDPYCPENIAEAIQRACDSPFTPEALKSFAGKFSWERCARETLAIFQQL